MKNYMQEYTREQLYDMFANQAEPYRLANQHISEIREQLKELAPDMKDDREVAYLIKSMAYDKAYPNG